MEDTAEAPMLFEVKIVNGFAGDSIWFLLKQFRPLIIEWIEEDFRLFADLWLLILNEFYPLAVTFSVAVHPTEIAFDLTSAEAALEATGYHAAIGFHFDLSHLDWQRAAPAPFLGAFGNRIVHILKKDAVIPLKGKSGI